MWCRNVLLSCLVTLTAAACAPAPGKLTLKLTDAPGDFRKAVVTIDRVCLVGEVEDKDERDGKGFCKVVLLDEPVTTDLLTLANDTADLVQDAVVPAGRYNELRFIISGGYLEVEQEDGSTRLFASSPEYAGLPDGAVVSGALKMPSFGESGLKVKLEEPLEISGDQKVLLVDFNVAESFGHEAGGSGSWVMHPVIKAAELTASGSIRVTLMLFPGVVLPHVDGEPLTLADFQAALAYQSIAEDGSSYTVEERLPLVDPDGNGVFEAHFQWLFPRSFTLSFVAPEGIGGFTTDRATPVEVTVLPGQESVYGFAVTDVD